MASLPACFLVMCRPAKGDPYNVATFVQRIGETATQCLSHAHGSAERNNQLAHDTGTRDHHYVVEYVPRTDTNQKGCRG